MQTLALQVTRAVALALFALCSSGAMGASDLWRKGAFLCTTPDGFSFPSKPETNGNPTPCDDGDMTLFNGVLCYAGFELGCEAVRRSQSADGRFWRSPLRAQNGNLHFENGHPYLGDSGGDKSFSPDMQTGVLLWAMKQRTSSSPALSAWFNWVANSRSCLSNKPFSGECLLRGLPRYCLDANCTMRPLDRDIDNAVYSWVTNGQSPPDGIVNYNTKVSEILAALAIVDLSVGFPTALLAQAYLNTPVGDKLLLASATETGFALHLTAIRAWMLVQMSHKDTLQAKRALAQVAQREPMNAFFHYLNEGPTPRVKTLVNAYCPSPRSAATSLRFEWIWEQSNSSRWPAPFGRYQNDGSFKPTAVLWDCIAMRSFLNDPDLGIDRSIDSALPAIIELLLN